MKPFLQILFSISCVAALILLADIADQRDREKLNARFPVHTISQGE